MFRKFQQNKLWRDKLIDMAESKGSKIHWTKLEDAAFAKQLKIKFMEEAQEVCATQNKEALIEELGDILEVINAFGSIYNFTLQDVCNARDKKYQERGGFNSRKFVTTAEHPTNSNLVDYYKKHQIFIKFFKIKYLLINHECKILQNGKSILISGVS